MRDVADGQQVKFLYTLEQNCRTRGKHKPGDGIPGASGWESHFGKTVWQWGSRDADRNKVTGVAGHASRKAAIDMYPVP